MRGRGKRSESSMVLDQIRTRGGSGTNGRHEPAARDDAGGILQPQNETQRLNESPKQLCDRIKQLRKEPLKMNN
jgi:hypothetical protein